MFQRLGKLLATPTDPRFDGAQLHPRDRRDVFVGVTADVMHNHSLPVIGGELGERPLEVDPQWNVLAGCLRGSSTRFDIFDRELTLLAPEQIGARVYRDAIEPSGEGRVALESVRVAECRDECFLGGVQCIVTVPRHPRREGEDLVFVPLHQCVERVGLSRKEFA